MNPSRVSQLEVHGLKDDYSRLDGILLNASRSARGRDSPSVVTTRAKAEGGIEVTTQRLEPLTYHLVACR